MQHGNAGSDLFKTESDRGKFLEYLRQAVMFTIGCAAAGYSIGIGSMRVLEISWESMVFHGQIPDIDQRFSISTGSISSAG